MWIGANFKSVHIRGVFKEKSKCSMENLRNALTLNTTYT